METLLCMQTSRAALFRTVFCKKSVKKVKERNPVLFSFLLIYVPGSPLLNVSSISGLANYTTACR